MDGSAAPFVNLIQRAGVAEQRQPKHYLRVLRPVRYGDGCAVAWCSSRIVASRGIYDALRSSPICVRNVSTPRWMCARVRLSTRSAERASFDF